MLSGEYFGVRNVRTGEQSLFIHGIMGDNVKLPLAFRDSAGLHIFFLDSCLPRQYFKIAVSKIRQACD